MRPSPRPRKLTWLNFRQNGVWVLFATVDGMEPGATAHRPSGRPWGYRKADFYLYTAGKSARGPGQCAFWFSCAVQPRAPATNFSRAAEPLSTPKTRIRRTTNPRTEPRIVFKTLPTSSAVRLSRQFVVPNQVFPLLDTSRSRQQIPALSGKI